MARPKIGFLPAFFTVLTIAFGIALWLRLRSYSSEPVAGRHSTTSSDTTMVIDSRSNATGSPAMAVSSDVVTTIAEGEARPSSSRKQARKQTPIIDLTRIPNPAAAPSLTTTAGKQRPGQRPGDKPSLISRLVNPIVNALTGGGSHPSSSQPGQQVQSSSSTSTSHGSTSTDTTGTVDKNDKTSDTTAPQLVSIVFNPPQVHDGEATVLSVQATDDLSGVRSISGTIASPSGAVQGFALQREGQTDQYSSSITVPKDAAEGVWKVNYLSLIDNASNAATLSGSQGALPPTASFRVISSNSDTTGPTLKAVWLDHPAMRAGEKNTVFVQADDDNSGVNLVSGVFISPAKFARIGFVCRAGAGDWECDLSTPACIDCGDWQLEQLQLQDKANNMTTIRTDNPLVAAVRVNITGDHCDATPPTLQSIVLDRTTVSNVQDSVITVIASASDDSCGIMSMSGQVTGPVTASGAPRLYFSFTPSDTQSWTGRISVPRLAAKGVWHITWIQVLDQGHNLKTYSQGDPPLANAAFNVQ
jgi:hypothetical protein